jgi:hypothetical protein
VPLLDMLKILSAGHAALIDTLMVAR